MFLGHPLVKKGRWEPVEEDGDRSRIRIVLPRPSGQASEELAEFTFESADLISLPHPLPGKDRMDFHRDVDVAPVPWLDEFSVSSRARAGR
jgi:hypothetical protein